MTRSNVCLSMALAMALSVPTLVMAQEQAVQDPGSVTVAPHAAHHTETVSATVVKVDPETRIVTLRNEEGKEVTVEASKDVRNFGQLKAGDVVTLTYDTAIALEIIPESEATRNAVVEGGATRADKGKKPGGTVERSVTITAQLTAIDTAKNTVTLKGPDGNERTIDVKGPKRQARLKTLKVGDFVRITYVEAIAVSVKPKAKG